MKQLVTKIKSWFKDRNDRKDREFLERTRIKIENHEDDDNGATELPSNQAEKMRELADKKRNKKPFYKDDKAKDWEQ